MIVTNGSGWCAVGKERHPILPGIMFLIPPGQKHEYQIPLGTLIFNIMFSRDVLSEEGKKILLSFPSGAAAQCPPDELEQLQEKLPRDPRRVSARCDHLRDPRGLFPERMGFVIRFPFRLAR